MPRTSPRPIVKPTGSYDPWVLQAIAEGRAGWAALPEWSGPPAAAARARGDQMISRPLAADLLPTALELARDLARDNDDRAGKWHDATWHDAPCMATAPKRRLKRQQLIAADKMRALMNSVPARTLFGDEERLAAAPPLPSSDSESDDGAAEAAIAAAAAAAGDSHAAAAATAAPEPPCQGPRLRLNGIEASAVLALADGSDGEDVPDGGCDARALAAAGLFDGCATSAAKALNRAASELFDQRLPREPGLKRKAVGVDDSFWSHGAVAKAVRDAGWHMVKAPALVEGANDLAQIDLKKLIDAGYTLLLDGTLNTSFKKSKKAKAVPLTIAGGAGDARRHSVAVVGGRLHDAGFLPAGPIDARCLWLDKESRPDRCLGFLSRVHRAYALCRCAGGGVLAQCASDCIRASLAPDDAEADA